LNNIYEQIKTLKGPESEIVDASRNDLPEFFKLMGYKVGVEIGSDRGVFTEILAKTQKVFAVDPWKSYPDYDRGFRADTTEGFQEALDRVYEDAKARVAPYDVTLIRKTSMEALADFEDESCDWAYIDGHHGFKYVTEDIYEWSKKVRKGGCIAGHDFVHSPIKTGPYVCHVKHVIPAYTRAFNISDWYVIGTNNFPTDPKIKRDRWRSWMWIKK
jgi:hypothetical protein